ncbi:Outer membrane protein beta-barrel domain-containing protein [Pedobacter terrae]|uniref:Outer membrane protein beta-barrel domain-containing protein n=1 Tax=Pedobacter terrae TaxID=405671 RepID=A0A1G7TXP7_9SPHI|nr:porin family protein [Pedobacter terrae]SDG39784.1 Outer membrane protein beta-barrel domain-containing protein [Pedobacter terrae]
MKYLSLTVAFLLVGLFASAQILPSFQLGVKAGANFSKFDSENTFNSNNRTGFYGGLWARVGAAGVYFQPELYISGKKADLVSDATGDINKVRFTSLDVPLLVGTKFGAAGVGLRLNTGPMFSLILDENQSFGQAAGNVFRADFKNQALAWQFGAGLDLKKLSFDARYELGLSKINKSGYPGTKLNLFTVGLGYRIL